MDAGNISLLARLQGDQVTARRDQRKEHVMLLGMIIAEVKNRELELRREVTDDDVLDVIRKGIKKRKESVELYAKAGRQELQDKEQREVTALETYLPAQVDPSEVRAAVVAAIAGGAANVGAVMSRVMPAFKGRVDGSIINAIAREELTKG
ncbi:MAG: GatB/YqeY domain-containing protein [Gemmatimonadaceae bacterium]|nr:GatB/YqeY domain-containing protein [Gemmatimonadaceae bacterium]